eukprot:3809292-Alexandrium_andersonii.AAC.1
MREAAWHKAVGNYLLRAAALGGVPPAPRWARRVLEHPRGHGPPVPGSHVPRGRAPAGHPQPGAGLGFRHWG